MGCPKQCGQSRCMPSKHEGDASHVLQKFPAGGAALKSGAPDGGAGRTRWSSACGGHRPATSRATALPGPAARAPGGSLGRPDPGARIRAGGARPAILTPDGRQFCGLQAPATPRCRGARDAREATARRRERTRAGGLGWPVT